MRQSTLKHLPTAVVMSAITAAAATGFAYEDMFATTIMFAGAALVLYTWFRITDTVIQAVATCMIILATLGWGLDLYSRIWWYDDVVHFLISVGGAVLVSKLLFTGVSTPTLTRHWLLVWLCWLGIGSLWEIAEWTADQLEGTFHSRGYTDTMMDMILNSVGSAVGCVLYPRFLMRDTTQVAARQRLPLA